MERNFLNNQVKILIFANSDGGLYNFRKELIERLIQSGNQVYISLPNGERIKDLVDIGCIFLETEIDRRGTNIIKDIKLMLVYSKILKDIKPDIVLTYTVKPNIYGGIICRIKKIQYICNITGLGTATENKGIVRNIIIFLYKRALKNVRCCFIQNEENMKFMNEKVSSNITYKLIPGSGVNLEKYKLLEYPEKDDKIIFLFIGRIMKEKGIEQYIDVAKYIKEKYNNVEFHILGKCEEDYEEKIKKLENEDIIKYYGKQKNIIPYLKESWCTIHPSYYPEGMSNVLLESCASGRPIITTDRSGCKEIVEDGVTGYKVSQKNSTELINTVEKFIKLPYEEKIEMGKKARIKMENEFDRNIVVNEYIKCINKEKN